MYCHKPPLTHTPCLQLVNDKNVPIARFHPAKINGVNNTLTSAPCIAILKESTGSSGISVDSLVISILIQHHRARWSGGRSRPGETKTGTGGVATPAGGYLGGGAVGGF